MAKLLQLRRGNTAEHASFTGEVGECTVDTDKDVLVVHDNSTAGGHVMLGETQAKTFGACATGVTVTSGTNNGDINFGSGSNQIITVNGAANIDVTAGSATRGQSGSIFFVFTGTALASFSIKFHWAGGQTNFPASSNTSGAVDRLDYIVYDATSGSEKIHAVYTNAVA